MLALKVTGVIVGLLCGAVIAVGWTYMAIGIGLIIGGTMVYKMIKER